MGFRNVNFLQKQEKKRDELTHPLILNHNLNMKKEFYLQWVKQWNIDLINLPADNP